MRSGKRARMHACVRVYMHVRGHWRPPLWPAQAPTHSLAPLTLQGLAGLWAAHALLVRWCKLAPQVSLVAGAWSREVLSVLLLNSANLGLVCRWAARAGAAGCLPCCCALLLHPRMARVPK